ncbi:MAG: bifunctional D-glycero-beta-D-manno-heptose-7-phosphate kinase/D-glycero-beta-D-manno-heptose 1-phosphate adenylyltransferase HldE [Gammaproteobacteria bacterium]|nr:bifunctional D-glycero-beta-D-manno-heptose-7-phosphate kinase/D-glycero-beta-D-manno-heptose 1-phosphate adenylyltransferase HldE [Gammaproteobacteria bacterium]
MTIKIPKYEDITILVVGDIMLDRYWHGATNRISPEAPVPVVHVQNIEERPGGAANVALNLKSLGCKVKLLGIIGNDSAGNSLEVALSNAGIDCHLQRVPELPTITKLRVIGRNQQLIRLDFEQEFHYVEKDSLNKAFQGFLAEVDAVIFSDYGKGTLVAVANMIQAARRAKKFIFVDPKSTDFTCYQNATLITPNLKEFQQVVGHCHSEAEIVKKAQLLINQHNLEGLLVTRGEDGMSLILKDALPVHLRAHAREVYDVSGAGDTVISVLAASIASGCDFETSSILANLAAGIVVKKLGVATVSIPELRRTLQRKHGSDSGILHEDDLIIAIEDARAHGEKIVMTNGCFDVLHAGHITYLEEARSLGNRLIVAINDDNSVKQLKGNNRPINTLQDRMILISALRCVDWVVSFSEDTPERLITRVLPDILVKGGDYSIPDIAGSKQVLENGGEVKILSFVEGYSSTATIKRMEESIC